MPTSGNGGSGAADNGSGGSGGFVFGTGGGNGGGNTTPASFPKTCEEAAESNTSVGCTFYPLHLPGGGNASFVAANVGEQDANVTLTSAVGATETQTIVAGGTFAFNGNALSLGASTGISNSGYVLESDQPLQVYQLIPPQLASTNDASLVLPEQVLSIRHRVVTYNDEFNSGVRQYVAIVATEDNTSVTFTLEQAASFVDAGGTVPALDKDNGPEAATVTLNRLEVLMVAAPNADPDTSMFTNQLSGSLVESDKPVAVYSGNNVTYAPAASDCAGGNCCCADLISTAVPPTTVYGNSYAGVKLLPLGQEIDVWRIIADHDDTVVTLSGGESDTITLDAGEFADVISAAVFAIDSNEPIGLAHFMTSGSSTAIPSPGLQPYDCPDPIASPGDPAVTWMYPTGNWLNRYVFEVGVILPGGGSWCHDHITVVAPTESWSMITLDGDPLPAATGVGASGLSYAYVPVDDGTHELIAPDEVGVEVSVYGYSGHGSYLFPAGMGLLEFNPIEPPR